MKNELVYAKKRAKWTVLYGQCNHLDRNAGGYVGEKCLTTRFYFLILQRKALIQSGNPLYPAHF